MSKLELQVLNTMFHNSIIMAYRDVEDAFCLVIMQIKGKVSLFIRHILVARHFNMLNRRKEEKKKEKQKEKLNIYIYDENDL